MIYGNTERALVITRLALGWVMLYAGWSKIISDTWSAAPYLLTAKTLPGVYYLMTAPEVLPIINGLNKWGLLLLGVSLISGVWIRISAPLGILLMLLYYLPASSFPYVGHGFLIDEHIIYTALLAVFWTQSQTPTWYDPIAWLKRLAIFIKTRKLAAL